MASFGSTETRAGIPFASMFMRVSQALQMAVLGGIASRVGIPLAAVFVSVSQTFQVTIFGSRACRSFAPPHISKALHVHQHVETSMLRDDIAHTSLHPVTKFRMKLFREEI